MENELAAIRQKIAQIPVLAAGADEVHLQAQRNEWVAARMYAIDIQYTQYEAALTREKQAVSFGSTVATLGLTGASKLVTPIYTKDLLTGIAGFVTGARAAYNEDILFAHTIQWVQSQMRTQRGRVALRIFAGLQKPTYQYTVAHALSDLEAYYQAGTFNGGIIGTSETVAADAKEVEARRDDAAGLTYVYTEAGDALRICASRPGGKEGIFGLLPPPKQRNFREILAGYNTDLANTVLAEARRREICN